jgi:phosphoadenylyl-sulfate reductase (thioredoxin)
VRGGSGILGMNFKARLSEWWAAALEPGNAPNLAGLNRALEHLSATQRVERAVELLPGDHVLTSSFGAQAAVMLHLVNTVVPGIPVILLDTGYLFPETYNFIDALTDRLKLNLKVFRADSSAAWQESRFGKLWDQGLAGIERYNRINKQEPLDRALKELHAGSWFAGLRRAQADTRSKIVPIEVSAVVTRSTRFSIGPTKTLANIWKSTNCPTILCGTRAIFRSAIGIPPVP